MEFTRGDDIELEITFSDSDTNDPIDITSSTIYFTVKKIWDNLADDTQALISKEVTSHTNPTGWVTKIDLTNADTDIEPWEYDYDFQVKDQYGKIQSTIVGTLKVLRDVTRRTS